MTADDLARLSNELATLVALPGLCAVATTTALYGALRLAGLSLPVERVTLAGSLALTGACCGVIAGSSAEPLVGPLVTAVLGVVSAAISYGFAKNAVRGASVIVPVLVVLIIVNFAAGLAIGEPTKRKWSQYADEKALIDVINHEVSGPVSRDFRQAIVKRCLDAAPNLDAAKTACDPAKLFPES